MVSGFISQVLDKDNYFAYCNPRPRCPGGALRQCSDVFGHCRHLFGLPSPGLLGSTCFLRNQTAREFAEATRRLPPGAPRTTAVGRKFNICPLDGIANVTARKKNGKKTTIEEKKITIKEVLTDSAELAQLHVDLPPKGFLLWFSDLYSCVSTASHAFHNPTSGHIFVSAPAARGAGRYDCPVLSLDGSVVHLDVGCSMFRGAVSSFPAVVWRFYYR